MKHTRVRVLCTLAAVVQCSMTSMVARADDDSSATADADAEETAAAAEAPPQVIEKKITAKAPAPSYSKDGLLIDINCLLRLDYPHNSSHVDGTVNVAAQVTCDTPVSSITLLLQLYYNGSVANSNINENAGQLSLYNQVAAPCINGGWQAHAETLVNFPPGVVPPSAYDSEDSQQISIDCSL
jgi:hypothetical protein